MTGHRPLPGDHSACVPGFCVITTGPTCCGGEVPGICAECDYEDIDAQLENDPNGELVSDAAVPNLTNRH